MEYEINYDTQIIMPVGDNSSKIIESDEEYFVKRSVQNIMEHSCEYFGSSFEGRKEGTKKLLGITHKSPIIIEETRKIIFFPTTSPDNWDCIWINLEKIDKIVSKGYDKLRDLEKEGCKSVDKVSDPFANIMKGIAKELFKEKYDDSIGDMMYALGKWVYIVDAIDDIDEDYKDKKFNLFLFDYDYIDKKTFLLEKHDDLEFILMNCYKTILDNFNKLNVKKYEGVLTNILWYGIKAKTEEMLTRSEKCKKIRI